MKTEKPKQKTESRKKLSATQQKRLEEFEEIRSELLAQGYTERPLMFSALKANIMVFVTTLPIVALCLLLFRAVHGSGYTETKPGGYFILSLIIGIVVHELIHGVTWGYFCKKKWRAISFGIDWGTLSPYCACGEALQFSAYVLGSAMPTIVLGVLPYIFGLVFGNYLFALFGAVNIVFGGGDAYMLWKIRKEKNAILVDHPYLVGCVAFEKQPTQVNQD